MTSVVPSHLPTSVRVLLDPKLPNLTSLPTVNSSVTHRWCQLSATNPPNTLPQLESMLVDSPPMPSKNLRPQSISRPMNPPSVRSLLPDCRLLPQLLPLTPSPSFVDAKLVTKVLLPPCFAVLAMASVPLVVVYTSLVLLRTPTLLSLRLT